MSRLLERIYATGSVHRKVVVEAKLSFFYFEIRASVFGVAVNSSPRYLVPKGYG